MVKKPIFNTFYMNGKTFLPAKRQVYIPNSIKFNSFNLNKNIKIIKT